ncbi:FAD-dependent oxidoreductase [Pseudomonas sp. RSB 5.4]|uniref:NAD(P)/FAD-dependent oxidoreductase n=1 Tax=Pseudomonas sp. RSB 5.4 TaxID=3127459 RepID=UPI0030CCDF50
MSKRIIVIGAGIVGASLAYHLAAKGAKVVVIEAGEIASGATGRSFAWINTSHGGPDSVAPLRAAAIAEYRRLESELPGLKVRWTGALSYGDGWFQAPSVCSAQILDLEPNLKHPPERAFLAAEEGALDAVQATHVLIAGAQDHGATVLTQTPVLGFQILNGLVTGVITAANELDADIVVLAAGTATPQLAACVLPSSRAYAHSIITSTSSAGPLQAILRLKIFCLVFNRHPALHSEGYNALRRCLRLRQSPSACAPGGLSVTWGGH